MRKVITKVYAFEELTPEAQQAAIENNYDINTDYEWFDDTFDNIKTEIAPLLGITIKDIYFSGFSSQGDGAKFLGEYEHKLQSVAKIKKQYPDCECLIRIAEGLQTIQKSYRYSVYARVTNGGGSNLYNHECTTSIDCYRGPADNSDWLPRADETAVSDLLRDFMRWIYRTLEEEHDNLQEPEQIEESITANNMEFTEDGKNY
jgi:hypothetical protein